METGLLDTGPQNVAAAAAPNCHGTSDDVHLRLHHFKDPNTQWEATRQARAPLVKDLAGQVFATLLAAAAKRLSSRLVRLLERIERRIGFYQSKTLSLVALRGAIETGVSQARRPGGVLMSGLGLAMLLDTVSPCRAPKREA
jgi:hypothetical protein